MAGEFVSLDGSHAKLVLIAMTTRSSEEILVKDDAVVYLRAKLASAQTEKHALVNQMSWRWINVTQKRQANRRYSAVVAEIVKLERELRRSYWRSATTSTTMNNSTPAQTARRWSARGHQTKRLLAKD